MLHLDERSLQNVAQYESIVLYYPCLEELDQSNHAERHIGSFHAILFVVLFQKKLTNTICDLEFRRSCIDAK